MKISALQTTLLATLLIVTGCGKTPQLIFDKEDLTGIPCCKIGHNRLLSTHDKITAEFALKNCSASEEITSKKPTVQAILTLTYHGEKRDDFNATVCAELAIDGAPYPLEVIHTVNKPITLFDRHYIPFPTGGGTYFSTSRDLTVKTLMLRLPYETLSTLSRSQKVSIEIKVSSRQPISFKFSPENLQILKEFKNKCIDQQPTKKD
ncbi:MAG: hypothetical protein GW748_06635 [Alphaproteobacteria bacterium]|nr:hypothetical protein [Alphaproteobacteria bacterium]NCQ67403.1 hypothetical protein [Alphaproteobacteria bacterium]NCT08022.1 hypothetical protein [Alphaproteobacteria bacterium]